MISGLFEVGQNDVLRVSLRVGPAFSKDACGPQAQHLVAARRSLETKLLVMRKLLFKAFFALVECCGHAALVDFDFASAQSASKDVCRLYKTIMRAAIVKIAYISSLFPPLHIASLPSRQHRAARLRRNYEVENVRRRDCAALGDRLG